MSKPSYEILKLQEEALYNLSKDVNYNTYIFNINEMIDNSKTKIILNDDFKTKWSKKKQSAYLKSVLIGFPSLFNIMHNPQGNAVLLNGKNRFFAIKQFLDDKIKLNDSVYLPELNGSLFSELPSSTQRKFKQRVENIQLRLYSNRTVPLLKLKW